MPQGGEAYRLWLLWFHFLLWQPPALLWLFTGEFAYHFSLSLSIFHFHFLFLTTTCFSLTIHGWICLSFFTFTFYFSTFTFYFDNHLRFFNYSRVNKFITFCGMYILQPICNHTDEISQLSWHENLTIQPCDTFLIFFQWKLSLKAIIFSVFYL